jgi:glycosyltransferase involved in cell wall biosynthesis
MWTLGRRRYNCDLVHETFFNARNLALASNARVSTFYDMITERFQTNPDYMERKRATAKLSDRIVAISESTKSDLQYYLEVPSEKIEVIYLASDLTVSTGARAVPDDRPFVLWVGNRSGYKNFDALIRAFAKAKIREAGFRIVCAGGPTLSSDEQELINDVGISRDRILHVAPTEDQLAALYRDAEMLVYVSKYEGFGLPPLEAMRCDCPVIASNTGSIPEITGDAALSVAPSDIDALSAGMDRLAEEPSLKEQLVKRGRRRCSQFSWQRCVTEHLSLYRSLL